MKRLLAAVGFVLLLASVADAQVSASLSTTTCPGAGCLRIPVAGQGSAGIQITGTFVGTLQFEQTIDGTNWVSWAVLPNNASATVTSTTAAGLWEGNTRAAMVQVRFSAYTSGTAVVSSVVSQATTPVPRLDTTATYTVHVSGLAVTASDGVINLEAEAGRGFRILQMCINPGQATAAAWVQWQLIRTTTASSAGTTIAAESTTTHSVTKMDPSAANWGGLARFAATEGTSGAVLDAGTVFVNIAATPPAHPGHAFCRDYADVGQMPTVPAGVTNGVKLMFTGTAGGAGLSAYIRFVAF